MDTIAVHVPTVVTLAWLSGEVLGFTPVLDEITIPERRSQCKT